MVIGIQRMTAIALLGTLLLCIVTLVANAASPTSLKNDTLSASMDEIHIITNTQRQGTKSSIGVLAGILQQHKKIKLWALDENNHIQSLLVEHSTTFPEKKGLLDLFSDINKQAHKQKISNHIFILFDERSSIPMISNDDYNKVSPLIENFQKSNINISTIHLGYTEKNAHLGALTTATNGRYQTIENIERLEEKFLDFISSALILNYLPLYDNLVRIDKNTDQVTFLLFSIDKNLPPRFIPPQGKIFSQYNYPDNVSWLQEKNFDIIRIDKPSRGTWQIDTQLNSHNKAIIKSPFLTEINPVPLHFFARSAHTLSIKLTQSGQHITNPKVLDHVAIKVAMKNQDSKIQTWFPMDNGHNGDDEAGDGIYSLQLNQALSPGQHNLSIDIDGYLFQRQINTAINVIREPAEFFHHLSADTSQYLITVVPYAKLLNLETMTVTATVINAVHEHQELRLSRSNAFEWQVTLDNNPETSPYTVEINIAATTYNGKSQSIWLGPVTIGEKQVLPSKKIALKNYSEKINAKKETLIDSEKAAIHNTPNRVISAIQLILINLLFGMLVIATIFICSAHNRKWRHTLRVMLSYD
ncbi:hypothetical protein MNBD_GAMMA16-2141 [hydrothermal vent metagenome]|uniref:VWFA domain-containing protein n=1 Tax=hydrothermal vent metagenome TaxID=652676 RepID=A0A3B0YZZ0_9ZZZZ